MTLTRGPDLVAHDAWDTVRRRLASLVSRTRVDAARLESDAHALHDLTTPFTS